MNNHFDSMFPQQSLKINNKFKFKLKLNLRDPFNFVSKNSRILIQFPFIFIIFFF